MDWVVLLVSVVAIHIMMSTFSGAVIVGLLRQPYFP